MPRPADPTRPRMLKAAIIAILPRRSARKRRQRIKMALTFMVRTSVDLPKIIGLRFSNSLDEWEILWTFSAYAIVAARGVILDISGGGAGLHIAGREIGGTRNRNRSEEAKSKNRRVVVEDIDDDDRPPRRGTGRENISGKCRLARHRRVGNRGKSNPAGSLVGAAVPDDIGDVAAVRRARCRVRREKDTRHRYRYVIVPRNSLLRRVLQNLRKDHHGGLDGEIQIDIGDCPRNAWPRFVSVLGLGLVKHLDNGGRDLRHSLHGND